MGEAAIETLSLRLRGRPSEARLQCHLRAACSSWMTAMDMVIVDACMNTKPSCSSPCSQAKVCCDKQLLMHG